MPPVSKAQRRYFGIAEHHPEQLRGPVPNMSYAEMHKMAVGSEKKLPEHVKPAKTKKRR